MACALFDDFSMEIKGEKESRRQVKKSCEKQMSEN
jgi:hypothetical protein